MKAACARTVCPASMVMTCPARQQYSFSSRSSGANPGTSLVLGPIRCSASTLPVPWAAAASRYGMSPSAPAAPRTALPSTAIAGSQPGPATGKATGPGWARRARAPPAPAGRAPPPQPVEDRITAAPRRGGGSDWRTTPPSPQREQPPAQGGHYRPSPQARAPPIPDPRANRDGNQTGAGGG